MLGSGMKKTKFIWGIIVVSLMASVITGCGGSKEPEVIQDFDKYISGIEDLEVPEGTRIVALGEATHGNREFQQSKKEVFELTLLIDIGSSIRNELLMAFSFSLSP